MPLAPLALLVPLCGYFFRVAAAFFAARERDAADLRFAAVRACRESALFEAAL